MISCLALLSVAAGLAIESGNEEPSIRLTEDGRFEVIGVDASTFGRIEDEEGPPQDLIEVRVMGAKEPMLGRVRLDSGRVCFEPRYAIRPGTTYRATFRPALLPGGNPEASPIEADLTLAEPEAAVEPTRVLAVYPTSDELPENLLRFYVQFSAPMSRGDVYRHLLLTGPEGSPVPLPFLELSEELWDPSGTRLTLLIDPGRIKQGLVPREELGPVLEVDRRYTLRIDSDWLDASGRPLGTPFEKTFRTGPADESPPDPADWSLSLPAPDTRQPLVVSFPEPLDHALLGRLLLVADADGNRVAGRGEVGAGETSWNFRPDAPWKPGPYQLVADTDLEDLAGNGIGRPFEVDVFDRVEPRVEVRTVSVPFLLMP